MDNGGSSHATERGRKRGRRIWSNEEENELLNILECLVIQGRRCDNGSFKQGSIKKMERLLEGKIPGCGLKATPHIESKLKIWKKQYCILAKMLGKTGFKWNDTLKCINVDREDTWREYIKNNHDAKGWRGRPFPLFERLSTIFGKDRAAGVVDKTTQEAILEKDRATEVVATTNEAILEKDRATGVVAITTHEAILETERDKTNSKELLLDKTNSKEILLDDNNASIDASMSVDQTSTSRNNPTTCCRKRPKQSDGILIGLQDIATSIATLVDKTFKLMDIIAQEIGNKREPGLGRTDEMAKQVVLELNKMDLSVWERCEAASKICEKPHNMSLFWGFPEGDRLTFVKFLLKGGSG